MEKKEIKTLKIFLIGGDYVGKSSIILRYVDNRFFESTLSNIGIDFKNKIIEKENLLLKLIIFDTNSLEIFDNNRKAFYRNIDGFFFICDINRIDYSLIRLNKLISDIKEERNKDYSGIICLNKIDLVEKGEIPKEIEKISKKEDNMPIIETSAKTGFNINEAFDKLVSLILEKQTLKIKEIEIISKANTFDNFIKELINNKLINEYDKKLKTIENNLKIVLLGDFFPGKNYIFNAYIPIENKINKSIILHYGYKIIETENNKIKIDLYIIKDYEITTEFINKEYLNDIDGIFYAFDMNNTDYIKIIKILINEIKEKYKKNYPAVMWLKKRNLKDDIFNQKYLNELNLKNNIKIFQYEKNEQNINDLFDELIFQILLQNNINNELLIDFKRYMMFKDQLSKFEEINKFINY